MMSAANEYPDRPPDDVETRVEALTTLCHVLSARVAELECSNAELRRMHDLDPPKPVIDKSTSWRSVKQVMHITGFSETQIRHLIAEKKIVAEAHGGRWYINVDAPMPHKMETAKARSGR